MTLSILPAMLPQKKRIRANDKHEGKGKSNRRQGIFVNRQDLNLEEYIYYLENNLLL